MYSSIIVMVKRIYKIYKALVIGLYSMLNWLYIKVFKIKVQGEYKIVGRIFIRNSGKIIFGDKLLIQSGFQYNPIGGQTFTSIVVEKGAYLEIKSGTGISNSSIYCKKEIIIGNNVFIGGDCKIYDTDFHSIFLKDRLQYPETGIKTYPIKINDGVFIGTGSIVLKGVTIGENSVIASGSVVSKSIPSNEIWGGNPIKFIKKIDD